MKLSLSCVLDIPFDKYEKDFSFIINDVEYRTSRFQADLLCPKISKLHSIDPTINQFEIKACNQGNFQFILDLLQFKEIEIPEIEKPFIAEIVDQLDNQYITFEKMPTDFQPENVLDNLKIHESHLFFSNIYKKEIEYISKNFYQIIENPISQNKLLDLSHDTLSQILTNPHLQLESEDQLLRLINFLYDNDHKYSSFYSFVDFLHVSNECISEFLDIFDISFLDNEIWAVLSNRFKNVVQNTNGVHKYVEEGPMKDAIQLPFKTEFQGVFNYIHEISNGKIENEIKITSSSIFNKSFFFSPYNVTKFSEKMYFFSENLKNSWIAFDFKKCKLILSNYTIRSFWAESEKHLQSWVIEGSNNQKDWEILDKQENCQDLNGNRFTKTFAIHTQNPQPFSSYRLRQIGPNCLNSDVLLIDSIEFYGTLVQLCST